MPHKSGSWFGFNSETETPWHRLAFVVFLAMGPCVSLATCVHIILVAPMPPGILVLPIVYVFVSHLCAVLWYMPVFDRGQPFSRLQLVSIFWSPVFAIVGLLWLMGRGLSRLAHWVRYGDNKGVACHSVGPPWSPEKK